MLTSRPRRQVRDVLRVDRVCESRLAGSLTNPPEPVSPMTTLPPTSTPTKAQLDGTRILLLGEESVPPARAPQSPAVSLASCNIPLHSYHRKSLPEVTLELGRFYSLSASAALQATATNLKRPGAQIVNHGTFVSRLDRKATVRTNGLSWRVGYRRCEKPTLSTAVSAF